FQEYFERDGVVKEWICLISDPVFVKNMYYDQPIPMHFVVETGLKLMNVLERIDNKPIKVMDLIQRFIAAGKSNGNLLKFMIKACEDPNDAILTDVELT
ncbi:17531_t:CDS:2, partial [Gigaspora rosea]